MKIKRTLVWVIFVFSFNLFSQSGKIIYEAEILINDDSKDENKKDKDFDDLIKSQNRVSYELDFNKKESFFKPLDKISTDNKNINLVKIIVGNGRFYSIRKTKKTLNQKEAFGDLFLIETPQFNWILTQESKKIGNYICYKATTSREIETRRGKAMRNITAWYTSQIPYNFGPKEYNGLPGLILELQEDSLLFKATKISLLTDKEIEIDKPVKGKKVTQKEYDSIVKNIILQNKRYKQK
jgi:GLPGLI family protein